MTILSSPLPASGSPMLGDFSTTSPAFPSDAVHQRVLDAAIELLTQGENLLLVLNSESYAGRVPVVFNASIGGHYRHCLDHFFCLLNERAVCLIDYDDRERDHRLEQDPRHALEATRRVLADLHAIEPAPLDQPVHVRCEVSYGPGESPVTVSSRGRELVYAIAHGIHHYAMISVIARLQKIGLPDNFGLAPSTVAHLKAHAHA